jgi:hypothetical protein
LVHDYDVHRFGALVLAQSIFYVRAGTTLLMTAPGRA